MTSKLTRDRLQEIAEDGFLKHGESKELARMALAAMESEPVATLDVQSRRPDGNKFALVFSSAAHKLPDDVYFLYRHAQPAPVVSEEMTPQQASRSYGGEVRGYRDGWNACRAAMLQAGNCRENANSSTNNFREITETSTRTAITPAVPDKKLTDDVLDEIIAGAKTSMEQYLALSLKAEREVWRKEGPTDDERIMAIEGINNCERCGDEGWIVGEMGITRCACSQDGNLTSEDTKQFEPVTTANKLGNSPVIPDGWVACSERMPEGMTDVHISNGHDVGQGWWDGDTWQTQHDYYSVPGDVTHWLSLPAAPQQEVIGIDLANGKDASVEVVIENGKVISHG
ncbi:DUF551 domain-containing protein [Klebsiella aerogenes]|uniref:DUF551 domain-containing protein n=1 Tax=Klebsiella aerogenes TaxID=548 RepID=UPI0037547A8D